jgi:hypothetical protein
LVDPGSVDNTGVTLQGKTTSAALRDLCDKAAQQYRDTGTIHTRPCVLTSAQAYLIATAPTKQGGNRHEVVLLNAGLMLYNPEKKENSFQLGHAYIRFYPSVDLLPVAPKAVLAQQLVYTYRERKPVPPIVAQAELSSGVHRLRAADFQSSGPFPVPTSPMPKISKISQAAPSASPDEDMPELVDADDSDMEVDGPKIYLSNPAPSPANSTVSNYGSETTGTIDPSLLSLPTHQLSNHSESLPSTSPASTGLRVPFFASKVTPNTKLLPSAFITIKELDRLIGRPPMGEPVFDTTEPASSVDPGELTSIFQIVNGAILHEHPRENQERLEHAWRALFDELQYQVVEEKSESFYDIGEVPNMVNRRAIAHHFENPEVCRQLTNRLRFRLFMSHILPTQPLIEQEGFNRNDWAMENEFRTVPVSIAGRWKYRRLVVIAVTRQLYRVMVFTSEYLLLRKVDHLFRARYAAYLAQPNALDRYSILHANRFFSEQQRRWLITAWEIFVFLQEAELSALVQFTLRIRYKESGGLDSLHHLDAMPRLPVILPGVAPMPWSDVLARQEDVATFQSHVVSPLNSPASNHSSIDSSPASISSILNPTNDTSPTSPSSSPNSVAL